MQTVPSLKGQDNPIRGSRASRHLRTWCLLTLRSTASGVWKRYVNIRHLVTVCRSLYNPLCSSLQTTILEALGAEVARAPLRQLYLPHDRHEDDARTAPADLLQAATGVVERAAASVLSVPGNSAADAISPGDLRMKVQEFVFAFECLEQRSKGRIRGGRPAPLQGRTTVTLLGRHEDLLLSGPSFP